MKNKNDKCEKIGNEVRNSDKKPILSNQVKDHFCNCLKCRVFLRRDQDVKARLKEAVQNIIVPNHLYTTIKDFVKMENNRLIGNQIRRLQ